jgi:4-hydroxy-4-methyl-2-oxoglutarate aldolase
VSDHVIVRSIDRPAPDVIAGLGAAGVATVHEAAGRSGLLDPGIRPIQDGTRIAGPAVTVSCAPGDNMMLHAAVEVVRDGDLVVVATTAPTTDGFFGELLATSLAVRGCRGLVIDGGVRDVAELRTMGFPVWSRAIHAQGTVKSTPGSVNVPVAIGATPIRPGDVVVADDDGVAIVPRSRATEVLDACALRLEQEAVTRRRLEAGELGVDLYGLREKLTRLGVRWIDEADG